MSMIFIFETFEITSVLLPSPVKMVTPSSPPSPYPNVYSTWSLLLVHEGPLIPVSLENLGPVVPPLHLSCV